MKEPTPSTGANPVYVLLACLAASVAIFFAVFLMSRLLLSASWSFWLSLVMSAAFFVFCYALAFYYVFGAGSMELSFEEGAGGARMKNPEDRAALGE
jgi:hypothetical protein